MGILTKTLKLKKTASVPNLNGCHNFGGITNNGNYIYCCKTNSKDNVTTIYRFPRYNSSKYTTKKFTGLQHSNGLSYYNGWLYIPTWGPKDKIKGLFKVNFKTGEKKLISGNITTGCIAHVKKNIFIIRTGVSEDKSITNFATIKIENDAFKVISRFSLKNNYHNKYPVNQDIYYKDGKLYYPLVAKNYRENVVLIANTGTIDENGKCANAGKTLAPSEIWKISKTSGQFEVESLTIDKDGHVLFALNSASEGIHIKN